MSSASSYLLQQLKQQFDSSFEIAPSQLASYDEVLFIRAAEQQFALLVKEINGLAKIERLTALPSAAAGFAGLSATRGEVVPVFDLAALLGLGTSQRNLSWMVRVDSPECALGLAFAEVEGYSRTPQTDARRPRGEALISRTVEFRGSSMGLINLEALVKKICTEDGEPDGQ
jgi:purine-binding chemotaxis protein CheW